VTAAFPMSEAGPLPQQMFRGLLSVHARYGLPARYLVQSTSVLSIHGDAPKSFLRIKEYVEGRPRGKPSRWPAYIAKVGSKFYPIESITEHLLTRLGQLAAVRIADSRLLMVAGQVRFLSKYFLQRNESLVHGIEIFKDHLDVEMVEQIAKRRAEQEFYTFQTVSAAIAEKFPRHRQEIMAAFVEMLAFDALVGNNDRHPANWGVIVPIQQGMPPRFSHPHAAIRPCRVSSPLPGQPDRSFDRD
jgi:hypothetical protein